MLGRLRLFGRRRRGFCGRSLRLDVDNDLTHFLWRLRGQRDEVERTRVKRDYDGDDERAKPGRPNGRRLEDAPVQCRGSHGTCAFGAAGRGVPGATRGAFGAAGVGATIRRGPDTIAIREIPFAASSSITDTTSP